MNLRVMTLNIHKGLAAYRPTRVLDKLKTAIQEEGADLVFLQEVLGSSSYCNKLHPDSSQYEFLADKVWPYYAYGKNAVTEERDHGNAILSKFPIQEHTSIDLSVHRREKRGLLHCKLNLPFGRFLNVFCTHLGLSISERKYQLSEVKKNILELCQDKPFIFGGDLNTWRKSETKDFEESLNLKEVHKELTGSYCKTFPALFPLWPLDRIYIRNLNIVNSYCPRRHWRHLSDHLALVADLHLR